MKPTGYVVVEACEDYEQTLCLLVGPGLPKNGILEWASSKKTPRAVFSSKSEARAAITRTEHYRLAFGRNDLPEKSLCCICPVCSVPTAPKEI